MEPAYPLERNWSIWEIWDQSDEAYGSNMQSIGTFSSLHTFWQHWNYLPHATPSELFTNPKTNEHPMIYPDKISIQAIGVFMEGVRPEWEDELNRVGCSITGRRPFSPEKMKETWDMLVFSIVGENLTYSEEVVGCRIVDKQKNIKFEVWLKTSCDTQENKEKIKKIQEELWGNIFTSFKINELTIMDHHTKKKAEI